MWSSFLHSGPAESPGALSTWNEPHTPMYRAQQAPQTPGHPRCTMHGVISGVRRSVVMNYQPPPIGLAGVLSRFKHVLLCATLWTAACQAPLSMGISKQEYWSGLPSPPPGDLPNPREEPMSFTSPALAGRFFITSAIWEAPRIGEQLSKVFSPIQNPCKTLLNPK